MIELPGGVSSNLGKSSQKAIQETGGKTEGKNTNIEIVQNNQVQFNTLQINQEIRNTYLRETDTNTLLNDYTWKQETKKT
jgi:hypothetical protein